MTTPDGAPVAALDRDSLIDDVRQALGRRDERDEEVVDAVLTRIRQELDTAWKAGRESVGQDMARPLRDDGTRARSVSPYASPSS